MCMLYNDKADIAFQREVGVVREKVFESKTVWDCGRSSLSDVGVNAGWALHCGAYVQ